MALIDREEIEKNITKIELYKNEEELDFDNILDKITDMNYCYMTNNTKSIEEIKTDFLNKFKVIQSNHNNNVTILNNTLEKYSQIAEKVKKDFENITYGGEV
jgi:hypothetical protein